MDKSKPLILCDFGLIQSSNDPYFFVRHRQGEMIIVVIYVDYTLILFDNPETFKRFTAHVGQNFEIRVLQATRFIRIDIMNDRENMQIVLHQRPFIEKTLERFGMINSNPKLTPIDPNIRLSRKCYLRNLLDQPIHY